MTNFMLKPIEHSGQRVVTTAQLAEAYGTDSKVISYNFNHNKSRYIEGKNFYCLTGEELRAFREFHELPKSINILYLWTERGTLLHAKSLNTDKAWEVHDFLTDHYFRAQELKVSYSDMILKMYQKQEELERRLEAIEGGKEPKKIRANTPEENAEYVLKKLKKSGKERFSKHEVLVLCRPLRAEQVTPALEILDGMQIISYRKINEARRGKPKEIIERGIGRWEQ